MGHYQTLENMFFQEPIAGGACNSHNNGNGIFNLPNGLFLDIFPRNSKAGQNNVVSRKHVDMST